MPDYRAKAPKFLWGAAFANTLNIGYRLDNVKYGSALRAGSSQAQAPSGVEDAWTVGTDFMITMDVRYIPTSDTAVPLATGWDGATGFQAFLEWARDKNLVRFYPDAAGGTSYDCYLVEPMDGQGDPESDGTKRVSLVLRQSAARFAGY